MSLDRDGKVEHFTGLLVGNDGRIEQVFQRSDKRPGKVDFKVDGKGRVVIPGLIDSHVQLMPFGLSLLTEVKPNAQPRPEDRDQALAKAQQALLALGITAVADMGTTIEDWQTYRRAGDLGTLNLRIMAYAEGVDAMILIGGPGQTPWLYDDRLRLNGVRLTLDGPLLSRGAALKVPYADAPTSKVTLRLNDTQLRNLMSRAAMDHFQVAIDASGDRASNTVLGALDEMADTYKGDRRWRIEQAEAFDPADLPRLKDRGVIASMQPQQAMLGSAVADARLGPARVASAYAWKSLAGAGASLAFGSGAGTPGATVEPFPTIGYAITRQSADGQPFGGWQAQERLTREAALAAYTAGAAYAGFAEGHFGRLTKGERADFLLIDSDPLLATPAELRAMRVLQTWVGGKLVYQAKERATAESTNEGR
ncbi:amidohydrolase family protein [Novosphingobium sp. G106]|uniref:amidohydrolase n=1 Tax=Novosphingobium sp. G106 TaxID=2849500 RepID=UPI001C2DAE83|nr:amidohydrolase family protein [Novosphingobium sp. G106]